jgi:hypothetical protein
MSSIIISRKYIRVSFNLCFLFCETFPCNIHFFLQRLNMFYLEPTPSSLKVIISLYYCSRVVFRVSHYLCFRKVSSLYYLCVTVSCVSPNKCVIMSHHYFFHFTYLHIHGAVALKWSWPIYQYLLCGWAVSFQFLTFSLFKFSQKIRNTSYTFH